MFTVDWSSTATMELASKTLGASPELKRRIAAAMREVDSRLMYEPELVGESRSGGLRVEQFGPLVLWFTVNVRTKNVFITRLRLRRDA